MSIGKMLVPLSCAMLLAGAAEAQLAPPYLEYAAKFTCGVEAATAADDVVTGVYASSINIHNPQAKLPVGFIKKIVVANRENAAIGRIVVLKDNLLPDQADRVDCPFIDRALDLGATTYVEGYVVIEVPPILGAAAPIQPVLDVTAKYTARPATGSVSAESVVPIVGQTITH